MINLAAFTIVLPAVIAAGIVGLWLTSKIRYFVVVLTAALAEYVFWIYWLRKVLTTPEYDATVFDYALLPTLALVIVMVVSWYAMTRQKRRVRVVQVLIIFTCPRPQIGPA
ncbi:hypothetical protein GCM10010080_30970 [Thermomonas carbonis]|nr:hypothetical protein GCM10010080_30970 [Thermomonas carbonis]